jgi:AAA+ ATPase superfamily predicted ATPase
MNQRIYGRDRELAALKQLYSSETAQLAVMYGRRRIGKTFLIESFCQDKFNLYFDGLENQRTDQQLKHLAISLYEQTNNPLLRNFSPQTWDDFFLTLRDVLPKDKRSVVVFDEFQWLACGRDKLVTILKSYWDRYFKRSNLVFILCGSIATYMVNKVVRSKALYGRIGCELHIQEIAPEAARSMLSRRGVLEALYYQLIFGGVPKYLEEIDQTASFEDNIRRLLFRKDSFFYNEIEKIFFSQFREAGLYRKIVKALSDRNLSLAEVSKLLKMSSSGGVRIYLKNLELAGFISPYRNLGNKRTREVRYKLVDSFLRFYYRFLEPHYKVIAAGKGEELFNEQVKPVWKPWLGLSFEAFLVRNALWLADRFGFVARIKDYGPCLLESGNKKAQIDLCYVRSDGITTVVEFKMVAGKIGLDIIPEMERKLLLLEETKSGLGTVDKILVCSGEVDRALIKAKYFHRIVGVQELLE